MVKTPYFHLESVCSLNALPQHPSNTKGCTGLQSPALKDVPGLDNWQHLLAPARDLLVPCPCHCPEAAGVLCKACSIGVLCASRLHRPWRLRSREA